MPGSPPCALYAEHGRQAPPMPPPYTRSMAARSRAMAIKLYALPSCPPSPPQPSHPCSLYTLNLRSSRPPLSSISPTPLNSPAQQITTGGVHAAGGPCHAAVVCMLQATVSARCGCTVWAMLPTLRVMVCMLRVTVRTLQVMTSTLQPMVHRLWVMTNYIQATLSVSLPPPSLYPSSSAAPVQHRTRTTCD